MKNNFRIEGDTKIVEIVSKGKTYEMLVDLDFDCEGAIGIGSGGYACIKKGKKNIRVHRLVMNAKKSEQIDHINHDKLDNRGSNLRVATHQQNQANQKFKGITFCSRRNKWIAQVCFNRVNKYLGGYVTKEEAIQVYQQAHASLNKEFSPYWEDWKYDLIDIEPPKKRGVTKGYSLNKKTGKYLAYIYTDGKHKNLGSHDTPQEARQAYETAYFELHGKEAPQFVV